MYAESAAAKNPGLASFCRPANSRPPAPRPHRAGRRALGRPGDQPGRLPPPRRHRAAGPQRTDRVRGRAQAACQRPVLGHRARSGPATAARADAATHRRGLAMKHTLRVNPIACTGHGICAELLPELIELDEWGYPILDTRPVPPLARLRSTQSGRGVPRACAPARPYPLTFLVAGQPDWYLVDSGAEQVPDAVGEGQADCPTDDHSQDGAADIAAADSGAESASQGESDQDRGECHPDPP